MTAQHHEPQDTPESRAVVDALLSDQGVGDVLLQAMREAAPNDPNVQRDADEIARLVAWLRKDDELMASRHKG